MLRGGRFTDDQAEVVFSDVLIEQLGELTDHEAVDCLANIVNLCAAPDGKHPFSGVLAGWNTLAALGGHRRIVYKASSDTNGTGLLEVLCIGPRTDNEVYDMAAALVATGLLHDDEITDLWDGLAVLAIVAEEVGVDGWDYRPPPASTDLDDVLSERAAPRCAAPMPRAGALCIRKEGHPGPHRASV